MNKKEIEEAGIDPNSPENNNVYHFIIKLESGGGGSLECQVNREGKFVGLETCTGPHKKPWLESGGGGGICIEETGQQACVTPISVDGHPAIQTLVIHGTASVLKQFFGVSMTISNLSAEPFKFTHGQAVLTVPDGMSLAPTPTPQTASQSVADVPGESSVESNWILRGDEPGQYYLSASYHGQLEPFAAPFEIQAATSTPLKVWGAEALGFDVKADSGSLQKGVPYHVKIGIINKGTIPLYNVAVNIDVATHEHFIFQPDQQSKASVGELKPGETIYAPQDILVPDANSVGNFEPEKSSASFVGEAVHPGKGIEAVPAPPLYKLEAARDVKGYVHLEWAPTPHSEGYEVFATPNLDTPFAESPTEVQKRPEATETFSLLPSSAKSAYIPGDGTEQFYAVTSIVGGRLVLDHPVIRGQEGLRAEGDPFEVSFNGKRFEGALWPDSVGTYVLKRGATAASWWQTGADNENALTSAMERQLPLPYATPKVQLPIINIASQPTAEAESQKIEGFGGALTDSAAYMLKHARSKAQIVAALYGPGGADFNEVRLPLGASDMNARPTLSRACAKTPNVPSCYAPHCVGPNPNAQECFQSYQDTPGDKVSIAHDAGTEIPVLEALSKASGQLRIVAAPWSPPGWMKKDSDYLGCVAKYKELGNRSAYASYLAEVAKDYEDARLPFSVLSLQNEPENCNPEYPTMTLGPTQEAAMSLEVEKDLKALGANQVPALLGYDHNWSEHPTKKAPCTSEQAPLAQFPNELLKQSNSISDIGYHSYCGLPHRPRLSPNIGLLVTESSGEYKEYEVPDGEAVPGTTGMSGANLEYEVQHELMDPLRVGARGSLYWNLALDQFCGPQFGGGTGCEKTTAGCGRCRPMVSVNNETGTWWANEDLYYWEQFSKFIQRGAVRLESTGHGSAEEGIFDSVAYENPGNGEVVLVVLNTTKPAPGAGRQAAASVAANHASRASRTKRVTRKR